MNTHFNDIKLSNNNGGKKLMFRGTMFKVNHKWSIP